MSDADEARYGRTSLLLLNVCPFTLRHVINDYYVKHGCTSLQEFLDKNKHDLYHILNRRCCCRRIQSRVTPMNRSQWDLLFSKNSSSCPKGYTGDCPCQYDGVTSDVMDITLCCLFIKNICTRHAGINMSHVDTIRTIRNHIIHAEKAHLDVLTYKGYWNRVKFALPDPANNVSPKVYTDTLNMIQELETRVMNAGELGEIRKLLVDQKRIEVFEENVSELTNNLQKTNKNITCVEEHLNNLEENVSHLDGNMSHTAENVTQLEGSVSETATDLTKLEEKVTNTTESSERNISHLKETVGMDDLDYQ